MIPKIKKVIDLTNPLFTGCPGWPTHDYTNVGIVMRHEIGGAIEEWLSTNVHTSTHIDAPYHFLPDGKKVDEIDPDRFAGRAVVFDLRGKDWANLPVEERGITVADLEACGADLKEGDIALLNTGWWKYRLDPHTYKTYVYDWPYITGEAADWLVAHGAKTVMTDGLSVGGWQPGTGAPSHQSLLGAEVLVVEEVKMPEELYEGEWFVTILPILIEKAGGSLARAIAMQFE